MCVEMQNEINIRTSRRCEIRPAEMWKYLSEECNKCQKDRNNRDLFENLAGIGFPE